MKYELSKAQIASLSKLKQKKFRKLEQKVVIEGRRLLKQLAEWGIYAHELYLGDGEAEIEAQKVYHVNAETLERICESDSPPSIAGLFPLPLERRKAFKLAFYLDGISDPGNMGTIFRIASAFGLECLLLSPSCCEVSSPKVIRASMGAVYKVPFWEAELKQVKEGGVKVVILDMEGSKPLQDYVVTDCPTVIVIGGEAHGIRQENRVLADSSIRIEMSGEMESLNAAVCAGICAYGLASK